MKYGQDEQRVRWIENWLTAGVVISVQSLAGGQEIAVHHSTQYRVHSCSISLLMVWVMRKSAAKGPKIHNEKKIKYFFFFSFGLDVNYLNNLCYLKILIFS